MFMKTLGIATFTLNAISFFVTHDVVYLSFCALVAMALMEKK